MTSVVEPGNGRTPHVSVVIPAYNAAATVGGTISGVLTQTATDFEVVVVDDGSTDRTPEVLAAYGDRIRVIRQENAGVSAARNTGAAAARGRLLVFCDSDDVLLPPAVETMIAAWEAAGGGRRIVTCNAFALTVEGINPRRRRVMESFPPPNRQRTEILRTNFVCTIALVPAEVFADLGGYDTSLAVAEDWDLWVRAIYAGVEIAYVREPLALYRWRADSLSSDGERMMRGEEEVFARLASRTDVTFAADERAMLDRRVAEGSPWRVRERADTALKAGDDARAAAEYRRASALFPTDRRLRIRAWSLTICPSTGRLWRARDAHIATATGLADTGPGRLDADS